MTHHNISVGGKGDSGGGGSGLNNIARFSNLSQNNAGLVDGQRNCACFNHGTFGPGWNPGERIEVIFDNFQYINGISLYLGCSQQHGEVASGSISYVDQNGTLMYLGSFSNVGIINNNGYLSFNPTIFTKIFVIEMSSGGGTDRNICFSEIEIY